MKIINKAVVAFLSLLMLLSVACVSASAAPVFKVGTPENFKATSTMYSVKLTWKKQNGFGTAIYQQVNGKWKQIKWYNASFVDTKTSHTVNNLKPGTTYKFAIKAHLGKDSMSEKYAVVTIKTKKEVAAPKVIDKTAGSVTLNWEAVKKAAGYRVYIKQDGKWKKLDDIKGTTVEIYNLAASSKYSFAVKHYKLKNGKKSFASSYGQVSVTTNAMTKVTGFAAFTNDTGTELSWNKVAGATGYRLYVGKGDGKWITLGNVTGGKTSYNLDEFPVFENWKFRIRAFADTADGKRKWTDYTYRTLKRSYKVHIKNYSADITSATIYFDSVDGATAYVVYGKNSQGTYEVARLDKDAVSYKITDLKPDTAYNFRVAAVKKVGSEERTTLLASYKKIRTGKADLHSFRAEEYAELFGSSEFTVRYYEVHDSKYYFTNLSYKGGDIALTETVDGYTTSYIYISEENATYVRYPAEDSFTRANDEYTYVLMALIEIMRFDQMSDVTCGMTKFNYEDVIYESFTEAKFGREVTMYFNLNDVLVGIETKYADGSEDTIFVSNVSSEVSDDVFIYQS